MPEDLLEVIKVPVTIAWGDQDPWEPIEQGREFANFDIVEVLVGGSDDARVLGCILACLLPLAYVNVFGVALEVFCRVLLC